MSIIYHVIYINMHKYKPHYINLHRKHYQTRLYLNVELSSKHHQHLHIIQPFC